MGEGRLLRLRKMKKKIEDPWCHSLRLYNQWAITGKATSMSHHTCQAGLFSDTAAFQSLTLLSATSHLNFSSCCYNKYPDKIKWRRKGCIHLTVQPITAEKPRQETLMTSHPQSGNREGPVLLHTQLTFFILYRPGCLVEWVVRRDLPHQWA